MERVSLPPVGHRVDLQTGDSRWLRVQGPSAQLLLVGVNSSQVH